MTNETDYIPCRYNGNGITKDFSFNWKADKATDLIVKLIDSENTEETLTLDVDYTVLINENTGNIKLINAPQTGETIVIERNTPQYQSSKYSTSPGFQGSELERSFDKVSLNLQEMQHNIDTFKTDFSNEINQEISDFEEEINQKITDFKDEVNTKIQEVSDAAEKINELEEAVEEAQQSAQQAEQKAAEATTQAGLAQQAAQTAENAADEAAEIVESKADISFSNITEAAKEVIRETAGSDYHLTQNQITNCILEVPNNIKIEIQSDGNLVLKAGSTVIIPDGFDEDGARKFLHKTIEQDVVTTNLAEQTTSYAFLPILNTDSNGVNWIGGINAENAFAGDTAPTLTSPNAYWYDTANNIIKFSSDTGASWSASQFSFPFCHVDVTYNTSGSYYNYPKAIFNHCGFIGSVFWADEGIKYLVPNGRNDDGTLNNIVKTTTEVQIHNITTAENGGYADHAKAFFFDGLISWWGGGTMSEKWVKPLLGRYNRYFNDYENIWKINEATGNYINVYACSFADFYVNTTTQILSMTPYEPLSLSRGANDIKIVETYQNGASWYRVWSDGWLEQGATMALVPSAGTINLIKPYKGTNYAILELDTGGGNLVLGAGNRTTSSFKLYSPQTPAPIGVTWRTSGYMS